MTANLITVIAVVAAIAWLGTLFVSAIRNRRGEEIASNLRPGITDEEMETKRLEGGQKAAIAFSAFLAISLPLYFLNEPARQENFVQEFSDASVARGAKVVEEFKCFSCHGPEGSGGVASYVEKRSGVTVSWTAPSINDVLLRYDEDEVMFWVTYGRGNTPMPAWGLAGGGPLNEAEVQDVVNYLKTIQIPQAQALNEVEPAIDEALQRLEEGDTTIAAEIIKQEQVIADIRQAPDQSTIADDLAARARDIFNGADQGIDTDADGLSDVTETGLSDLSAEAVGDFTVIEPVTMDPATADAELADQAVAALEAAVGTDPIVTPNLDNLNQALESGSVDPSIGLSPLALEQLADLRAQAADAGVEVPAEVSDLASAQALKTALDDAGAADPPIAGAADLATAVGTAMDNGSDPDGDGISNGAENAVSAQTAAADAATFPPQVAKIKLDPANPESVGGQADVDTANGFVGGLESLSTTLAVTTKNEAKLLDSQKAGLRFLQAAQSDGAYKIDIAGVAAAMGVTEDVARRAVGLFNSNCARCHTAGYSAGVPYTKEAGSGGFGPALWDGRPTVQFGPAAPLTQDDLLIQFLIRGSEAQTPYGLNGFGSGRMPAFGAILSQADIELLAKFLRAGNLDGMG
jgi:mono/diheme cytochrome c family protein